MTVTVAAQQSHQYQDPAISAEARITDLLGQMTVDEKIDALNTDSDGSAVGNLGTLRAV